MPSNHSLSSEPAGIIAALCSTLLATVLIMVLMLNPDPGDKTTAIIFPPGTTKEVGLKTTLQLGGTPLSFSSFGTVVFANFERVPGFLEVWNSRAFVAVNPFLIAGCNPRNQRSIPTEKKI